jgi:integrase/recombinase XerD
MLKKIEAFWTSYWTFIITNTSQNNKGNIISYLNSLKEYEEIDPLHKWIGTYNSSLRNILRFFKWLYSQTLAYNQRLKSKLLLNVSQLSRNETSIYKPTELWTLEDDIVFLKWRPNKR